MPVSRPLLLFLLLLFAYDASAQKNTVENGKLNGVLPLDQERVAYQQVGTVDGVAAEELFKRGRQWFATAKPVDVPMSISDLQTGELSSPMLLPLRVRIGRVTFVDVLHYTLTLEVKNGRYRIRATAFQVGDKPGELRQFKLPYIGTTQNQYTDFYAEIDRQINGQTQSLITALNKPSDF